MVTNVTHILTYDDRIDPTTCRQRFKTHRDRQVRCSVQVVVFYRIKSAEKREPFFPAWVDPELLGWLQGDMRLLHLRCDGSSTRLSRDLTDLNVLEDENFRIDLAYVLFANSNMACASPRIRRIKLHDQTCR